MNPHERMKATQTKQKYPSGTRIQLIEMDDSLAPVPAGMRGTVELVDDAGQIHMKWDNGRTLALIPGVDQFRRLTEQEVVSEKKIEMATVTTEELRQMQDQEGLILQGCGGDLAEWVTGINEMLTEQKILLDGTKFKQVKSFKHNGLTNLYFPFTEGVHINTGKLAMWRLATHEQFGGTWLSDYIPNQLGGFAEVQPVQDKPDCPLIGQDGNIFNLIGIASRTLREHGLDEQVQEMQGRIYQSDSYYSALNILGEYVNITSIDEMEDNRRIQVKIQQYLDRIGFAGKAKQDLETLEKLVCCHLEQVPFENLDCYRNPHPMSLKIEELYEKVVLRRRGGICFELNGLFLWLLECIGFDVYPILVRIQMGSEKLEPISHEAIIVTLEGQKYYCDVGFGGPAPKGLVSLDDGQVQLIAGEQYRTVFAGCQYEIQWYHRETWETLFSFVDLPAVQEDFEILMYYFSACPESEFVRCRLLNLCLPDGSLALTDHQFTKREAGKATQVTLKNQKELMDVIEGYFHLEL